MAAVVIKGGMLEIIIPTTALNTLENIMLTQSTTTPLHFLVKNEGLKSEHKYNVDQ